MENERITVIKLSKGVPFDSFPYHLIIQLNSLKYKTNEDFECESEEFFLHLKCGNSVRGLLSKGTPFDSHITVIASVFRL